MEDQLHDQLDRATAPPVESGESVTEVPECQCHPGSVSDLPEFSRDFDGFDSILKWDGISGMEVVFGSLIFWAILIV